MAHTGDYSDGGDDGCGYCDDELENVFDDLFFHDFLRLSFYLCSVLFSFASTLEVKAKERDYNLRR